MFPEARRRAVLLGVLVIALTVGVMIPKIRLTPWGSANTKSRYAQIQCMVEERSFAIDCSPYKATMDRVKIDGRLYSSKPPVLATLAASVYAVTHRFGATLESKTNPTVWATNLFFAVLPHVVLLFFFLRILLLVTVRDEAVVLGMIAAGLGFLGTGYATDLNNHTAAATAAVVGLFAVLRAERSAVPRARDFAMAGLAAGFLPTLDLPAGAIAAAYFVALFLVDRKKTLFVFVPCALPPVVLHLALTWAVSGSLIPIYLRPELYEYRTEPPRRDGVLVYLWHMTFGHHGIFSMTPTLALGAIALVTTLKRRTGEHRLALLTAATSAVLLVFYLVKTHNYGGVCVGFRWAIVWMPLVLVFFARFVDELPRTPLRVLVVWAALGVASLHTFNALDNPWADSKWQKTLVAWSRAVTPPPAKTSSSTTTAPAKPTAPVTAPAPPSTTTTPPVPKLVPEVSARPTEGAPAP